MVTVGKGLGGAKSRSQVVAGGDGWRCALHAAIKDVALSLTRVGLHGGNSRPAVRHDGVPTPSWMCPSILPHQCCTSDTCAVHQPMLLAWRQGRPSGRVLVYDPATRATSLVAAGLWFANGVALSQDESFLVIGETFGARLMRHWLTGAKAGETEVRHGSPHLPVLLSLGDAHWPRACDACVLNSLVLLLQQGHPKGTDCVWVSPPASSEAVKGSTKGSKQNSFPLTQPPPHPTSPCGHTPLTTRALDHVAVTTAADPHATGSQCLFQS